ncbi:MAG: D-alanyl-D-alanine carboxypeptidase/D-alanyl-D-alanine endopeptidase [Thermoanaerobaculia bacterium]
MNGRRRGWAAGLAAHVAFALPVAGALPDTLATQVQAARRAAPALGLHVRDLTTGATVYELEADRPRIIASNVKLFTTAAALDRLSPGYFFETRVLVRGEVVGGELRGDLAVVGGGDPNLSGRHTDGDGLAIFRRWGEALAAAGVQRIAGDVLLDHGLFRDGLVHPDWPTDQLDAWYEAPVAALSFDDNCVLVRVRPGSAPGRRARVEVVPDVGAIDIVNTAITTASRREHGVVIRRASGGRAVAVSGRILAGGESLVEAWITVPDPLAYFGAALTAGLAEAGVEVGGAVRPVAGLALGDWRPVALHRTDLLTTVEVTNKRSQNFYAESLLKVMGAELCGEGSWAAGRRAVSDFIAAALGFPAASYQLADGSGMSRNNRFTARQLTDLLAVMFVHPRGKEFLRSLPYSGEADLRWERRLADPPYRANVFAKTGGLRGVSTLSGYAKARSGKLYAFSILMNEVRDPGGALRAQDGIVRALIDHG